MTARAGRQREVLEAGIMKVMQRSEAVLRGKQLEYLTIAWNAGEGLVALVAGLMARSISLVGFGVDSLIEVTSGSALLWRMSADADMQSRERREKGALRIVGACFLTLAAYVAYESVKALARHQPSERSPVGIALTAAAVVVMPLLARAKRKVAIDLGSAAMQADAQQSAFCSYLSAIVLLGLLLNALFGFWWADSVAGLLLVPFIAQEGIEGVKGEACACH